jgi:citrate lyase alpha subunit
MSYAQFQALMAAINDVRSELTERLDRIELRLREVEDYQTKAEALEEAGQERSIALRWRVGIAISALGAVMSFILQVIKLGGN